MRKLLAAAAAAAALSAAPAIASAWQAAPSLAAATEVRPAGEQVEGSEICGGFILPLIGIVAILVTVWLLARDEGTNAVPLSP